MLKGHKLCLLNNKIIYYYYYYLNCNTTHLVFPDISLSSAILKCSQTKDQRLIFADCITCEPYCSNLLQLLSLFTWLSFLLPAELEAAIK